MNGTERAKRAWETMRSKSPGEKANYTRNRKIGARNAIEKTKQINFQPEKIAYLLDLNMKSNPETCVVCGDTRSIVLQTHHVDPEKTNTVKLCANCHDVVRRGTLEDLRVAYEKRSTHN